MDLGLELKGIEELEKALDASERRFDQALRIAVSKGAAIIQQAAKSNIHPSGKKHKDPSWDNLRKHIVRRVWKRRPGFVGILVGPLYPGSKAQKDFIGRFVEEGHRKSAPGKRLYRVKAGDLTKTGRFWRNQYATGTVGERDAMREELGSSKTPPHPFLRPAFDNNKTRAAAEMAKILQMAIDGKITESDAVAVLEELIFGG